jgi:amidase
VARLREAGAIPFARTNLPDFGLRWHTHSSLRGATINPYDPSLSPGGSSGGEAVALATGMSPLGLGNDYGGSIRIPSRAAGTVGLRPTLGRVASTGSLEPLDFPISAQLFGVDGPMARTVADVAVALGVLSGRDAGDPWWTPAAFGARDGLPRVAVCADPAGLGLDADVAAGVERAAAALRDAGYDVVEQDTPLVAEAARVWLDIVNTEMGTGLAPVMHALGGPDAITYMSNTLAASPPLELGGYIEAFARRSAVARAWSLFQEDFPLVLGPVSTVQPHPVGYDLESPANALQQWEDHRLTVAVNLLGLPSLAVPAGRSAAGLPQGVQLIGPRYGEALCLAAGAAVESALGAFTIVDPVR